MFIVTMYLLFFVSFLFFFFQYIQTSIFLLPKEFFFNISCSIGLMVMISLNFCLSEKNLYFTFNFKRNFFFSGQRNLGKQYFSPKSRCFYIIFWFVYFQALNFIFLLCVFMFCFFCLFVLQFDLLYLGLFLFISIMFRVQLAFLICGFSFLIKF